MKMLLLPDNSAPQSKWVEFAGSLNCFDPAEAANCCKQVRQTWDEAGLGEVLEKLFGAIKESPNPDRALLHLLANDPFPFGEIKAALDAPAFFSNLVTLVGISNFCADLINADPRRLSIVAEPTLEMARGDFLPDVANLTIEQGEESIRKAWEDAYVAAAVLDLTEQAEVKQVLEALSILADRTVQAFFDLVARDLVDSFGYPAGVDQGIGCAVIAMGKHGGMEVNVSSDLDLVFVYRSERGNTHDGQQSLSNPEFYARFVHSLCRMLENLTAGGPYRIDLRLRPGGNQGDVASSLSSTLAHYEYYGQTWERQAWMRARVCAGDKNVGEEIIKNLTPFVYRKSVDWKDLADLANLRERAMRIASDKGAVNIKLGAGGIREVEFTAQSFQLLFGGADPNLRTGNTLDLLKALSEAGRIPDEEARQLSEAYCFFRRVENALQWEDGRQTHSMPTSSTGRAVLARLLQIGQGAVPKRAKAFDGELEERRKLVRSIFESLVFSWGDPEDQQGPVVRPLSTPAAPQDEVPTWYDDPLHVAFVTAAASTPNPGRARKKLMRLEDAAGEEAVKPLLMDPVAVDALARLLAGSDYLGRILAASPELLDSLLDPRQLLEEKTSSDFAVAMQEFIAADKGIGDVVLEQTLRIGMRRILNQSNARQTMEEGSDLAAQAIIALAKNSGLTVYAMGAVAGREMVFTSDLDLVFAIASRDPMEIYEGTSAANGLMKALSEKPPAGPGYAVDLRLRPYGNQGALVTSGEGMLEYLSKRAAPWEKSAYLRAVRLVGDGPDEAAIKAAVLDSEFSTAIAKELAQTRSRALMERGNPRDLKWGKGGLADLEWLLAYYGLKYGKQSPDILQPNTAKALMALSEFNLMATSQAGQLCEAFFFLKDLEHVLRTMFERPVTALPDNEESLEELAKGMSFADANALTAHLAQLQSLIEASVQDLD